MNYIEQMMETAEVKPKYEYTVKGQTTLLKVNKEWLLWKFKGRKNKSIFKVVKVNKYFPDFISEKQLKLFLYICSCLNYMDIEMGLDDDKEYCLIVANTFERFDSEAECFSLALARLTTELINAGELDKEKVKEILK